MKVLLKRVNLNGHIKGFHLTQTIKKVITNLLVSVVGVFQSQNRWPDHGRTDHFYNELGFFQEFFSRETLSFGHNIYDLTDLAG